MPLPAGAALALGLVAAWAAAAFVTLTAGGLTLNAHEGDAAHLAAIVLRMADGEWPHLDFMTPIGIGALAPVAWLVAGGAGLGQAFLGAQAAMAAALLPALWWVGVTRLGGGWLAFGFGVFTIALTMAAIHGGPAPFVAVSMHYNRWAWAVAFVVLALTVLPSKREAPRLEGALLGAGLAWLALTKVTYFIGLAPVALLALALRRQGRAFAWASGAGLAVAAAVTAAAGPAYWTAYLGDLLAVATSDARPMPGLSWQEVMSAPTHLGATLAALAAVAVLRQGGRATEGTILLVALPGFVLITWQNFGNDPQWLPFVAVALLALRPEGEAGRPLLSVALVAGALALPSALNVVTSPVRVAAAWADESQPLLPGRPEHADFRVSTVRTDEVMQRIPAPAFSGPPETAFWGGTLPACETRLGSLRTLEAIADEVAAAGLGGRRAFVTDILQAAWLFGDVGRLPGGAPWHYGGVPGAASVEIVIVPLCPSMADARRRGLDAVEATGWTVREAFRGEHAVVLEIDRG